MSRAAGWLVVAALCALGCVEPSGTDPDAGALGDDGGVDAGTLVDAGTVADAGVAADAGFGTDGGVGCTRAGQTRTADLALLEQLRADVQAATSQAELDGLTEAFFAAVAEGGGTPLRSRTSEKVAFVARDAPAAQYSVGGSWNGWTPGMDVLARVGQSGVWALERALPATTWHEYKMVDGQHWYEDRRAQNVVWDGLDRAGVGELNAVVYPERLGASRGRLLAWRAVKSATLQDARDVFVYLPAAYDDGSCRPLPTLYFHDGNESLTRAPFTRPADETYQAYPAEAALLVFVALPSQDVRMSQYTFGTSTSSGDGYLAFLKDELVPKVEERFRTCRRPRDRGLAGASLGGLISGYGALQHPDVFGYVGSQSGSYFWENDALVTRVKSEARLALRWYVDHGCPNDNCDVNRVLAAELTAKGYEVVHVEEAGGQHDWAYWQKRLPRLLRYFREGRSGCEQ